MLLYTYVYFNFECLEDKGTFFGIEENPEQVISYYFRSTNYYLSFFTTYDYDLWQSNNCVKKLPKFLHLVSKIVAPKIGKVVTTFPHSSNDTREVLFVSEMCLFS